MSTVRNTALRPVADYLAGVARSGLGDEPDGDLLGRFARDRGCRGETGAVESGEQAFAELVRRHGGAVRAACVRALGDAHADADDCVQAVFLVLARRAGEFADRPSVGAFLHGVAVRVAWKARARRHRRDRAERRAARPEAAVPTPTDDAAAAVDRAVQSLPAALREVVVLCDLAGVSRKDAAVRLGIPEGTLSSRRAAAHARLARRLGPGAVLPAAVGLSGEAVAAVVGVAIGPVGSVPLAVQCLVRGVVGSMMLTKLKPVVAAGLMLAVACGTGVGLSRVGGQPPKLADAYSPATSSGSPRPDPRGAGSGLPAGVPVVPKPFAPPTTPAASREFLTNLWQVTAVQEDGRSVDPASVGAVAWMYFDDRGRGGVSITEERLGRVRPRALQELPVFLSRTRKLRELSLVVTFTEGMETTTDLWQMVYEPLGEGRMRVAYFKNWAESDRPLGFTPADNPGAPGKLVVAELKAYYPRGMTWKTMMQLQVDPTRLDEPRGHGFNWPQPGIPVTLEK